MSKALEMLNSLMGTSDVDESLADPAKFIDSAMLEHVIKDIEANGKTSQFYTMFNKYKNTSDVNMRDLYSYMMMMSPTMARNYIMQFTQKEVRNGVYSADSFFLSDSEGGSSEVDMMGAYIQPEATSKGMFTDMSNEDARNNPEQLVELRDWFDKFINNKKLTEASKLVVIARLMTGDAAGRGSMNSGSGLPLNELVDDLPPEYDRVMTQIQRLINCGFSMEEIDSTKILRGVEVKDDSGKVIKSAPQLVTNHKMNQVGDNVSEVISEMTGKEVTFKDGKWDLKPVYRWLLGRSVDESKDPMSRLSKVIGVIMGGKGSLKNSDLIGAIVMMVDANIRNETPLAKSWKGRSIRDIASEYKKYAKSGNEKQKQQLLLLFVEVAFRKDLKLAAMMHKLKAKLNEIKK